MAAHNLDMGYEWCSRETPCGLNIRRSLGLRQGTAEPSPAHKRKRNQRLGVGGEGDEEASAEESGAGSDDGDEFEFEAQVCTWLVDKLPTAASLPENLPGGFRISYTALRREFAASISLGEEDRKAKLETGRHKDAFHQHCRGAADPPSGGRRGGAGGGRGGGGRGGGGADGDAKSRSRVGPARPAPHHHTIRLRAAIDGFALSVCDVVIRAAETDATRAP